MNAENLLRAYLDLSLEVAGHQGVLIALLDEVEPGSFAHRELTRQAARLEHARHAAREKVFQQQEAA